jgi:hypothetical protein
MRTGTTRGCPRHEGVYRRRPAAAVDGVLGADEAAAEAAGGHLLVREVHLGDGIAMIDFVRNDCLALHTYCSNFVSL